MSPMTPTLAEVRIPIQLDIPRMLIFNLNTMAMFEQTTRTAENVEGKFYFDVILKLFEIYQSVTTEAQELMKRAAEEAEPGTDLSRLEMVDIQKMGLNIIRKVSMIDLRALIFSALHEYPKGSKVPEWPLTIYEVGRHLTPLLMPGILRKIIDGHSQNSPTRKELGEVSAVPTAAPVLVKPEPKEAEISGLPFTELPVDALG